MSLTNLIQYDENWKKFFKEIIPKKNEFKTVSGCTPFSKEYKELVPYGLENRYNSAIVGSAFDYLARWMVAKTVKANKKSSYTDLVAELGVRSCYLAAKEKEIDIEKKYNEGIEKCKQFVNGKINIEELIEISVLFAKLEQVFRRSLLPFQVDIDLVLTAEEEICNELKNLIVVFDNALIKSHIVKASSKVIYNPAFGQASCICGGADADIYIDGILYDFKCTKKHGYVWNEVAQILGYYLLDRIAKKYNDQDNDLKKCDIDKVAFYRARYGEIEYVEVDFEKYAGIAEQFENLLDTSVYNEIVKENDKEKVITEQANNKRVRKRSLAKIRKKKGN